MLSFNTMPICKKCYAKTSGKPVSSMRVCTFNIIVFVTGKKEFQTNIKMVLCYNKQETQCVLSLRRLTNQPAGTIVSSSTFDIITKLYLCTICEQKTVCY